jgi:hypothetical protein
VAIACGVLMRGGEEERPVDSVRDNVLREERVLLGVMVARGERHLLDPGLPGDLR